MRIASTLAGPSQAHDPAEMGRFRAGRNRFRVTALVLCAFVAFVFPASATEPPGKKQTRLIPLAAPGPQAIELKVSTPREMGKNYWPGDQVTIELQVNRTAYVTIVTASSKDGVSVVVPSRDTPSLKAEPNKTYTLFAKDSRIQIRAGDEDPQAELAVIVSSAPFRLAPLEIPKNQPWLIIRPDAKEQLEVFYKKLKDLAGDKGFNRVILTFPDPRGNKLVPEAMLLPGKRKRLVVPGGPITSERPGSATGVQGQKMELPKQE